MRARPAFRDWLPLGAVVLLLVLLGALQYRWAGQLGEAELARARASARDRGLQLGAAFDREVSRAFAWLGLTAASEPGRAAYAAAWARWQAQAPWPRLVRAVWLVDSAARRAQRFDPVAGAFVAESIPTELAPLQEPRGDEHGETRGGFGPPDRALAGLPALLVPVFPSGEPTPFRGPGHPTSFVVVLLDRAVLAGEILPALDHRFFDPEGGFDYSLRVTDTRGGEVVYASAPDGPARTPDVTLGLFDVRLEGENKDLLDAVAASLDRGAQRFAQARPGHRHLPDYGRWSLALTHRATPLAEVVAAARRRNLAVGFGVLALAGASAVMLVLSARRVHALAGQQMQFVAGITHELQTPLAVMASAAENLADGVIRDGEQVRRYGALLRGEARRLSQLVDQVLAFVGTYSGTVRWEPQPLALAPVVEETLHSLAGPIAEAGAEVAVDLPAGLPPVQADPRALRSCLDNLVHNALKYRGESRELSIAARVEGGQVALSVADRGLGFAPDERRQIFEPFFRGRAALDRQIPGSGLGLGVVRRTMEALGGSVEALPRPGGGSVFTLRLPVGTSGGTT